MQVILGSQSKGRRSVLESMGYSFTTMSPDIDEKAIRFEDPEKLTLTLAHAKADSLLPKIQTPSILITSDQVVVCNREIREKPESEEEARKFLISYVQHPAETVTAVIVVNTENNKRLEGVDRAKVWFQPIPDDVIGALIKKGTVFLLAGGFTIEDPQLEKYIMRIEGERESIIGLPKALTERLIREIQQ